jgi:two-component system copper resistance phosphate regulon response regulator CusR
MRVLVLEDDEVIAGGLAKALTKEGYRPTIADNGPDAVRRATESSFGLIVLDVMVPGIDGFEVCRRIRRAGIQTPVLMLTAKDAVEDRVTGLDTGADDYLVKPFDVQELLARLRALKRREAAQKADTVTVADLTLDSRNRTVTRAGKRIELTPREFDLLEALARNTGRTLTRQAILERVWNDDESLPNTVNFHVVSLRRKVDEGHGQKLIHTVHGLGYTMKTEGE